MYSLTWLISCGEGVDRVVEVGLIGSSPDGITVLLQAVQVDDLDVGVVLAGDLAVNNDGHEATVAGQGHQKLVELVAPARTKARRKSRSFSYFLGRSGRCRQRRCS